MEGQIIQVSSEILKKIKENTDKTKIPFTYDGTVLHDINNNIKYQKLHGADGKIPVGIDLGKVMENNKDDKVK